MTDTFESSDTEIGSTPSAGWDVEKLDHHTLLVEWKMAHTLWERVRQFLYKCNMRPPYDPAAALWGVYPREMTTRVHVKTRAQMFTAS